MTAKEELLNIVGGWSEAEAEKWLCAIEPRRFDEEREVEHLSAAELLRLPAAERSAIIRAQLAKLTQQELDEYVAEAEAWAYSDADALKHIDD